jgi:proline iminopeptidase
LTNYTIAKASITLSEISGLTEQYAQLQDGTKLWTNVTGSGPPVVLVNGGPGMADYLAPLAALLAPRYTVHRFEPRGCGRSPSEGPFTLNRSIDDIEQLRAYWGHSRWWIVGHSWGVDLGLAYALQHREHLSGLIGLAGGRVHNDREWHKTYSARRHEEPLPDAFTDPNMDVNQALNREWRAFCQRPTLLRELAALAVPSLFVYGESDIRPSWPTEQVAALMPKGTFAAVANADHHLWESDPKALADLLFRFMASV